MGAVTASASRGYCGAKRESTQLELLTAVLHEHTTASAYAPSPTPPPVSLILICPPGSGVQVSPLPKSLPDPFRLSLVPLPCAPGLHTLICAGQGTLVVNDRDTASGKLK